MMHCLCMPPLRGKVSYLIVLAILVAQTVPFLVYLLCPRYKFRTQPRG